MIVDENERHAGRQFVDELKDLLVSLRRNKTSISFAVEPLVPSDIAAPSVAGGDRRGGIATASGPSLAAASRDPMPHAF